MAAGHQVVTTKEPGGTKFGVAIRAVVLGEEGQGLSARTQLMLFEADRMATVRDVVAPGLLAGSWVVSDRGPFGSSVYQGHMGGIPLAEVEELTLIATGGRWPDLAVVLDLPVEESMRRIANRPNGGNWLDKKGEAWVRGVRAAYQAIAAAHSERVALMSAMGTEEEVAERVWSCVSERLLKGTKRSR